MARAYIESSHPDETGDALQISDIERQSLITAGRLHEVDGQETLAGLAFEESVFYLSFAGLAGHAGMAGSRSAQHFHRLDARHRRAVAQHYVAAAYKQVGV